MATAILGLACLATDLADWQRGAELHGAAEGIRTRPWGDLAAAKRGESLDSARRGLGEEKFGQAFAYGLKLTVGHAFDLALHGSGSGTP